jgi:hypothetical protein
MTWSEYEERYGESREDFIDIEEEDVERCIYCESTDNLVHRKFKALNQIKTELICSECLAEEQQDQAPLKVHAQVA